MNFVPSPEVAAESTALAWKFEALDSWFFRESRPFDSIGGAQLASLFPPPMRTLTGAIRTAIGEHCDVDWARFQNGDEYADLRQQMGDAQGFGHMQLSGPYLFWKGQRLFAAPRLLLEKGGECRRLLPGDDELLCDLGRVRLPRLEVPLPGAAPLENTWLTAEGLQAVLNGGLPDLQAQALRASDLWSGEERLGIGRNARQRANIAGLLYQTSHVRPHVGLDVGVEVHGVATYYQPSQGTVKLGGEGRLASFRTIPVSSTTKLTTARCSQKIVLMLLTAADFAGDWKPRNWKQQDAVWHGEIGGIRLRLISAVLGKIVREGGWDVAANRPRPVRSLVPAGSCYFCEVEGDARQATLVLNGARCGEETQLGRGELAVGLWEPLGGA